MVISDTAPSVASLGELWFDSIGGQLYIWYVDANSGQWTPAVNQAGGYLSLAGGVVQGPVDLKVQTVVQSGANLSINRALGENVSVSLSGSVTSIAVAGWPNAGITGKVRLVIREWGVVHHYWLARWHTLAGGSASYSYSRSRQKRHHSADER